MMLAATLLSSLALANLAAALPAPLTVKRNNGKSSANYSQYYDIQGHRGTRGFAVENTLAAFSWGILAGVTTLELDNGITKDGHAVVWHDETIQADKCLDTAPVTEGDSMYPYVGKHIANLTLAQIKTLDCGSERLQDFPFALTYPGLKISTLPEFFDFIECTGYEGLFNIESKVNPIQTNSTRAPSDFVDIQLGIFEKYGLVDRITYQSFDWRTIKASKQILPQLVTSALADDTTLHQRIDAATATSGPSDWFAGIDIDDFEGDTDAAKLVRAAKSIGADILSPGANVVRSNTSALDPTYVGYVSFVNASMIETAHSLGMSVKPYTVDRLATLEQLNKLGIDGIISDYPEIIRNWAVQQHYKVAPRGDEDKVKSCFAKHAQFINGTTTLAPPSH